MNANMQHVSELTGQRIAASQEDAVCGLVRSNAMLVDEVEMLQTEVNQLLSILYGQSTDEVLACEGCLWWNDRDLFSLAPHCDNSDTPEPWRSSAMNGGLSGCPNHAPPCRVCADEDGGPRATGNDGLCDGCRGVLNGCSEKTTS